MKKPFILHLVLVLNGLLLNSPSYAGISDEAPAEIKVFTESDFDSVHMESLKTHAVPLKILIPALILEGRSRGWIAKESFDYKEVFKRAGLTYPDNMIYNKGIYAWKSNMLPAGVTQKEMDFGINANVKVATLSCIACHSNLEYNSQGFRTNNLVLGSPSDTFNPETYVESIYRGMKRVSLDWDLSFKIIKRVFPDTSIREMVLLKTVIKMQVIKYVKTQSAINRGTPFNNGGPGLTNGVSSLKNVLKLNIEEGSSTGFTSIPSLGDRGFRSSLLYDGVYSPAHKVQSRTIDRVTNVELNDAAAVVALFTIPTMGQTTKRAYKNIDFVVKNVSPILKTYKTPVFPGAINSETAARGMDIYNKSCMECHGEYQYDGQKKSTLTSFPNIVVSQADMNSDPERWKAITPSIVTKLKAADWSNKVQFNANKGYVAPILEGLWASAPYMHNGSVPTLWSFLRPESRPKQFIVGYQNLDLSKVGHVGVQNSLSEVYDTSLSGRSNRGHEKQLADLSESDKEELLEFLKTL